MESMDPNIRYALSFLPWEWPTSERPNSQLRVGRPQDEFSILVFWLLKDKIWTVGSQSLYGLQASRGSITVRHIVGYGRL